MSKRKVVRAKIHDVSIVIPGYGTFERDLPPVSKKVPMNIEEGEHGLEVSVVGISTPIVIPYPNVQIYFIDPTPQSEATILKAAVVKK